MSDTYIVETTAEVINLYKDGRSKDWNKLPTIPAGSRCGTGDARDGCTRCVWLGSSKFVSFEKGRSGFSSRQHPDYGIWPDYEPWPFGS